MRKKEREVYVSMGGFEPGTYSVVGSGLYHYTMESVESYGLIDPQYIEELRK